MAARGTGAPWQLVTRGHSQVFPDGTHEWREHPDDPRHRYISALAPGAEALARRGTA